MFNTSFGMVFKSCHLIYPSVLYFVSGLCKGKHQFTRAFFCVMVINVAC